MNSNPEKIGFSREHDRKALDKIAAERRDALRERFEKIGEKSPENGIENAALHEALENAATIEHEKPHKAEQQPSPAERRKDGPISKTTKDNSFKATMSEVQGQMSVPSRAFSKIIHNKAVEKVSDVGASTIARPNAILSGAICAFILTLGVYMVAKTYGFPLRGFETIGAFILGWIIGIVYDFLKVMVTGRR